MPHHSGLYISPNFRKIIEDMKMRPLPLGLKESGWCLISGFHLVLLFTVVISCTASGTQNIGSFKENPEITQGFQSHQYLPEHTYYYAGLKSRPEAVVGIHRDYRIQETSSWGSNSTKWKELETTTENLKNLVDGIDKNKRSDRQPAGVLLFDPARKQVGVLYVSINRNYQPRIRVFEDNRVNVVATAYVGPPRSTR
jgi:hypothetical protein